MIDYLTVVYNNYHLLDLQVKNFKKRFDKKDYRLIVVDNTPDQSKNNNYYVDTSVIDEFICKPSSHTFDGISHGGAIDYGLQYCNSDIVAIIDSDFFILNKNIHNYIYSKFGLGYKAIGCEYHDGTPDSQRWVNINPANFKDIPCCFGSYYAIEVAKSRSWVITSEEVQQNKATGFVEVGWNIRKYILENNIKSMNWKTSMGKPCYFYDYGALMGVHCVAGSHARYTEHVLKELNDIIDKEYE